MPARNTQRGQMQSQPSQASAQSASSEATRKWYPGTKRKCSDRNQVPGSISFVPSVAGLMIAGEIVRDIID